MQKLEVYQSLWAMELRHPDNGEFTAEQNFSRAAQAGFAGLCLDPAIDEIETSLALKPLYEQYHLGCMVNAFPAKSTEMKPLLQMAGDLNACMVNVISTVMPLTPEAAVPVLRGWMREAAELNIPLLIETHRNSMLNDLYFTLQVIDAIPELRLCADLSHFVVDREFQTPLCDRDQGYISRILQRSDCIQGRIASAEQVQIQIDFPQHQQWVDIFRAWWKQGMAAWRARNPEHATFRFLCELGPPPYAITDGGGYELSDRWHEALTIKRWVEEIWAELEQEKIQ